MVRPWTVAEILPVLHGGDGNGDFSFEADQVVTRQRTVGARSAQPAQHPVAHKSADHTATQRREQRGTWTH